MNLTTGGVSLDYYAYAGRHMLLLHFVNLRGNSWFFFSCMQIYIELSLRKQTLLVINTIKIVYKKNYYVLRDR